MEQLNLLQVDFLANRSVLPESVRDFLIKQKERYFSRLPERLNKSNHALYSLKTSKGYSITTKGTLLEQSSTRLMNWGTMSNGVYITAKTSTSHKIEKECTLSDILEETVDEKYFLSSEKTEKLITVIKQIGNLSDSDSFGGNPQTGRVYADDGLSPTLNTMQGGGREPKVMVKEATKKGYDIATIGDSINISQPNSKTRRGRVGHGIANTLVTGYEQATLTNEYRIRKLTPRECWRLQAFPDELFDKAQQAGLSDSQLYKQAGNSVTVNVIEYIGNFLKKRE